MEQNSPPSGLQSRSPAVLFIDERLPHHDPAFMDAPSAFDQASGQYLPVLPASSGQGDAGRSTVTKPEWRSQPSQGEVTIPDQERQTADLESMKFWDNIFEEAIAILLAESVEPKILGSSACGIRNASGWGEVCSRLSKAQNAYTGEDGTACTLKRMRRRVADNFSQPAAHITKLVPDIEPWTTPVAGTFGLLLQAMTVAAKTRQEVLTSLSDLSKTFSNINSFAATFPRDDSVREASVSLVVSIFQAVEQAMAFFLKSSGRRAAAAVLTGSEYQTTLLNSFNEVQKRSNYLVQKAQNSHYEGTRTAMQEILTREAQLLAGQAEAARHSADTKNTILSLMQVYVREKELDRKQHQEELRRRDEIQKQQDAMHRRDRQELIALMNQLQIAPRPVSPLPAPLALLPSPSSWDGPPMHVPSFPIWTAQSLLQLLGVPDVSSSDLSRVKNLGTILALKDKKKADRVVQSELFRQWMGSVRPVKLLVHGDFRGSRTASPLTLLTATLTEAGRADPTRFVTLVFFCSCHIDPSEDALVGGKALIQSLICQLLHQQPHMNISPTPWEFHPERVGQVDLQQLCHLFSLLVRHLPSETTLFCLIDCMVFYERDEFIAEAHFVLAEITRLVGDPAVQANTKLLITSPWRSGLAHQFFQGDREVLNMHGMPSIGLTPSSSRVIDRYMLHSGSEPSWEGSPEPW
ncbi:hypothetical protein KVR01_000711 [Diaporthe batatas]|uniref:uncharacterized protein n=1 Tax=Diaporthe batatas TaxID=748121 RepID=UPI001D03F332|nr:uncharacterized protein KVR01_000711 [Diaporthe batatas]KAG8169966.1 hypothetical protein KVR01_000711 [Diaporthe batatas]